MKRLAILGGVMVALVCLSGVLFAQAQVYHGVYGDITTCGLGGYGSTEDWQAVVTPSGNIKLTCHGETDVPLDKAVKVTVPCAVPDGEGGVLLTEGTLLATPGGQVTLVCMVKANN